MPIKKLRWITVFSQNLGEIFTYPDHFSNPPMILNIGDGIRQFLKYHAVDFPICIGMGSYYIIVDYTVIGFRRIAENAKKDGVPVVDFIRENNHNLPEDIDSFYYIYVVTSITENRLKIRYYEENVRPLLGEILVSIAHKIKSSIKDGNRVKKFTIDNLSRRTARKLRKYFPKYRRILSVRLRRA